MEAMYYILRSNSIFVINPLEFTEDYTKATQYSTIGEAMKMASKINASFGKPIFAVFPMYTPVSSNL